VFDKVRQCTIKSFVEICRALHLIQAYRFKIVEPCRGISRVNYCKRDSTIYNETKICSHLLIISRSTSILFHHKSKYEYVIP